MRAYVAASVAKGRHIVGVMGGSSTPRNAPAYRLAAATAKAVSEAGFLVATGGGLGIMEAGNLGAYFAGRPDDELHAAIDDLKRCPVYRGHEAQYIDSARSITAGQRAGAPSLAVATWRYDDEPISQFATHIAKLFQNSVREDGLLSIADAGVAYFEGGFGTRPGDLPRPRPERLRRAGASDGHGVCRHRRVRRARIALPSRTCPRRPRRTAVRRPHHSRRLSRRGRRGHDGRSWPIPPHRMTRVAHGR